MYTRLDLFPIPETVGERIWGSEVLLYNCPGKYSFKILKIKAGQKGGLQYHRKKDEVTYIVSGEMLVRFDLDDGEGLQEALLRAGDCIRFPTGMVHQEEAITDVVRIEASTPYFNDRVRVESKYGIAEDDGLPTTMENEIVER